MPSPYWLYSVSGPCLRRCWSRSFTRARFENAGRMHDALERRQPGADGVEQPPDLVRAADVGADGVKGGGASLFGAEQGVEAIRRRVAAGQHDVLRAMP